MKKEKKATQHFDEIDSISEYESEFHHAFMKSKLENDEFIHVENAALTRYISPSCSLS